MRLWSAVVLSTANPAVVSSILATTTKIFEDLIQYCNDNSGNCKFCKSSGSASPVYIPAIRQTQIPFTICSTVFNSAGQVVARGCTTETDEQTCLNDANCLLCSPGDIRNCNAANISESSSVGNRFIRFLR
ncbi:uncharacterized protein LOC119551436 [Drosophila subpulchrella]|uniref:uncharacterized protein LOC119551434 n=1 Tax=Drosophila subpulchrella TaxID=1486046 RepID=UPI0018A17A5D|nr:uncharacterized protein LOC119551434 [Drosophila subpulchrella]XP_037716707.1 uncharacterized protein LOC119551436 [Drosophila subpulchrella]